MDINKDIDKVVNKFLKNLIGIVLSNKISTTNIISIDNTVTNVQYIDQNEVNEIVNLFINYINTNFPIYTFSLESLGTISLVSISSKNNSIVKDYLIPISLFESSLSYMKNIKLTVILTKYANKYGNVIINNIDTIDIDPNTKPLLPSLSNYPDNLGTSDTNNISPVVLLTNDQLVLAEKQLKQSKALSKESMCFNTAGSANITNQTDCLLFGGVWDSPAQNDTDCPYYLANKNYTNNRGGTKNGGYCDFPVGLKPVSFKVVDSKSPPICYNCTNNLIGQGTKGTCCSEQTSPDYEFPGDSLERQNASKELQNLGLSVI